VTAPAPAPRILVVEDDPAWAELTREAFAEAAPAAQVSLVRSAPEALELLAAGPRPDLVLIDLNMPGTDGRELLRSVRALPGGADQPVAVLSASATAEDRTMAARLDAVAYVNKPTTFGALCRVAAAAAEGTLDALDLDASGVLSPSPSEQRRAGSLAPSITNLNVVLVTSRRGEVAAELAAAGFAVRVVPAVAVLGERCQPVPDCVLVDLEVGHARPEVLRAVSEACPGTPVVALVGERGDAASLAAVAGGAQDVVAADEATRQVLARTVRFAVERSALARRTEEALTHLALHDPLTGLANRTLALDRLAHALDRGAREKLLTGVLFLDLDRFKTVNDTLGHLAADHLLQIVSERLTASVRPGDTVARLSGDEFLVITEAVADDEAAEALAERLLEALSAPVEVAGTVVHPSASIGIAVTGGELGVDEVLRRADAAMYEAKRRGRHRYHRAAS
jgi:diguanylate cyclase (GGDEF)-like protein